MSTAFSRAFAVPTLLAAALVIAAGPLAAQAPDPDPAPGRAQAQAQAAAPAWQWPDPVFSDSELLSRASDALLLDVIALADGRRHVAVGERGHVLVSDDQGNQWRQIQVPTRSTLTALAAAGNTLVAVGHDGVILHSDDAGEHWQRVREEPYSQDNRRSPSNGSPLLDVLFLDEQRVIAVGAYTLMLFSNDGGQTWQDQDMVLREDADSAAVDTLANADAGPDTAGLGDYLADPGIETDDDADAWSDAFLFSDDDLLLGDEADPHLNALARLDDGRLLLVGERGSAWRSDDDGQSWLRLALPYAGSMYGLLAGADGTLLAFGLRGRVLESSDGGDSWRPLDSASQATLFDGLVTANGDIILVGGQGRVLHRPAGSDTFSASTFVDGNGETPTLAGIVALADGRFLLAGERGIDLWEGRP
ncbi:MAG: YCF48-related protein [Xanthomonadales bacterium]|nr:YCF48-related protein [Xanthomonadales bacterium]